jgi:hypothetical protein
MQVSQSGSFVFVVKDGIAQVQPVKVARVMDSQSILEGGELVVTSSPNHRRVAGFRPRGKGRVLT